MNCKKCGSPNVAFDHTLASPTPVKNHVQATNVEASHEYWCEACAYGELNHFIPERVRRIARFARPPVPVPIIEAKPTEGRDPSEEAIGPPMRVGGTCWRITQGERIAFVKTPRAYEAIKLTFGPGSVAQEVNMPPAATPWIETREAREGALEMRRIVPDTEAGPWERAL